MQTYMIIRFYEHSRPEILRKGLTLKQAQDYCSHPESSSTTAKSSEALARTENGAWFDGYTKED